MRYSSSKLREFMTQALNRIGVSSNDAQIVADNLLKAELQGISSHGISRFPVYFNRVKKGLVNSKPNIMVEKTLPAVITVDGDNGLGSVVMMKALEEGIALAEQYGISAVGIKRSNHFGIAGYYCDIAAAKGYISILVTNGPPAIPPWGGREAYLGTNPIAFGLPRRNQPHIIIDLATSLVARGKIINAAQKGEQIPENWALNKDGYPTTSAKEALEGVLLPMAGPKGYALSLAVEHLAGVLTGAGFGRDVAWQYSSSNEPANVGHFLILIKLDAFLSWDAYEERTERFCKELKDIKLAPEVSEIKLPGEREWEKEQMYLVDGVVLEDELIMKLAAIANDLGLDLTT